jgi:hypothetical protein
LTVVSSNGVKFCTSNSTTITASGGSGTGYTFAWTRISGNTTIIANSPTSATTTFSGNTTFTSWAAQVPVILVADMRCTVTDSSSNTVTVDVEVELDFESGA